MDRLALHIEYLLRRHDCVVVPGIGAFMKVEQEAEADETTGIFNPMTEEVRFNSALVHDDGLLASSYSRREHISFAEGRELIRKAVEDLREVLGADGQSTIGRLGLLMNNDGILSFRPFSTPENISMRLGLVPVRFKPRSESLADDSVIYRYSPEQVKGKASGNEESISNETAVASQRFDTARNYYIPINKMFARLVGSFLLVALVGLSIMLPFGRDTRSDQASVMPVKAITEAVGSHSSDENIPAETTPAATQPASSPEVHNWHLIVATFHSQSEADKFIEYNDSKGYDLSVIKTGKCYRVSARNASDKEQLVAELGSDEFKAAFSQAWIFNSENK